MVWKVQEERVFRGMCVGGRGGGGGARGGGSVLACNTYGGDDRRVSANLSIVGWMRGEQVNLDLLWLMHGTTGGIQA